MFGIHLKKNVSFQDTSADDTFLATTLVNAHSDLSICASLYPLYNVRCGPCLTPVFSIDPA